MESQAQETRELTEQLLAGAFGSPVRLDAGQTVEGRDYVVRFGVLEGPDGAPSSVIAKRGRSWGGHYDPDSDDPHNPAWGLFGDWAALQFLSEVAGDAAVAPRFYGGDRNAGLIAIEDLGSGERPDQLLLGDDPVAAEAVLVELAAALGKMHARTAGRQAEFDRIRNELSRRWPPERDPAASLARAVHATIDILGLTPPAGLDADLGIVTHAIREPGPFLAYTHGDPCPDNWLRVDGRLKLFDFERGQFRHALLDGVYGRIHFPTCWCVNRSPEHVFLRMESAYRAELVQGCPEAADDTLFYHAVVEACAFWAIDMCQWIIQREAWYDPPKPMQHDQHWGIATLRQRALVRSDILARTTQEFGHLEAIGATFAKMAAKLRTIWPPEADAMPLYPAFRAR